MGHPQDSSLGYPPDEDRRECSHKNRFTVSRTGETGVLWLRFQSQKGNSG